MEEQLKPEGGNQFVYNTLRVRTMHDDLKNAPAEAFLPIAPVPAPVPKQAPPQPKKELVKKEKEQEKPKEKIRPALPIHAELLNQARQAFEKKRYEEAVNLAQKIIQDKNIPWLFRFRARRLLNKVKQAEPKEEAKISMEPKIIQRPLPEPPPYLPTEPAPIPPPKPTPPPPPIQQVQPVKPVPPPKPIQEVQPSQPIQQPKPIQPVPPPTLPTVKIEPTPPFQPKPVQPTAPIQPKPVAIPSPQKPVQPPVHFPQPRVAYEPPKITEQPRLIYGQPIRPKYAAKQRKPAKVGLLVGVPATIIILGIFAFIYYNIWGVPTTCQEGQLSGICLCGGQPKTSGFCCNNLWSEYGCFYTKAPEPLISNINATMEIDAQGANTDKILTDITNAGQIATKESAKIVALKMSDSPKKYATLDDLASIFGLTIPDSLKTNTQASNLLVYFKSGTSATRETRFVLVLSQKDSAAAKQIMTAWETTMLADLLPLILGGPSSPTSANFINTNYNGGLFRFKNLPTKTTALNYTLYKDLVIIGTSKNSIFYVYDSVKKANP